MFQKTTIKLKKTRQELGRHVIKYSGRDFDTVNCEDPSYLISKYLVDMGFGLDGMVGWLHIFMSGQILAI